MNSVQMSRVLSFKSLCNKAENSQQNVWQEVKQGLFNIQRIGIQKFGVDGYTNENSKNVHEYLYNPISLNSSSIMYQPFAGLATEGKK
ncbi:hypothetical protein APD11_07395 [Acinetobacter baumannii]|nr:hypothetical protein APD11_07395 [Acinetobacter baumannii]